MEKGTTSYILRGIPFCLWVAFTSFRKTWHKGQLLEDRGTEMTARGIQVKQKDSSVRGVIFTLPDYLGLFAWTLTWQDPVHSWTAGPGEVMTVENIKINKPYLILILGDKRIRLFWREVSNCKPLIYNCNWVKRPAMHMVVSAH